MVVRRLPVRMVQSPPDAPPPAQETARPGVLFTAARATIPELRGLTTLVARNRGETIYPVVRIKSRARAIEKARTELGGRFEYLVDIAASTVVLPNLQALYAGACVLVNAADVVRLRDRFEAPRASGYSDMIVNVRMSNRHIVEIQLHAQPMFVAKQFEQVLYSRRRSLATKNDPRSRAVVATLTDAAKQIFAVAAIAIEHNRPLSGSEVEVMSQLTRAALDAYEAPARLA